MESNYRFYLRRAAEETARAAKAVTPASRQWHEKLAKDFRVRAQQFVQAPRAGILDKFYVEHSAQGSKVMTRTPQLTVHIDDDEIDENIQMLKDDLDACASEMKRLANINRESLFEGWSASG